MRSLTILLALGVLGLSSFPAGAATQSFCDKSSWVGGVTELCAGHLVYRDYVYDDYGADTGLSFPPIATGSLAPSAGDVRYPAGAENTADLVRLELWLEGGTVHVEFELNTLYGPGQTIAAIALDTDGNAATGGGEWPGLGITSAGWDEIHVFTQGDPATNLISGTFPKPASSAPWTIRAVTAQADGTVMNVAFRGPDEQAAARGLGSNTGAFWEDRQAQALGTGDITGFSAVVDPADLTGAVTRGADVQPGFHQRVYTSAYTLGEGISLDGIPGRHGDTGTTCEQYFHYLGKYQPYGVYIPAAAGPHGLQLVLHGCSANHASLINQPGMQQRFGEELNRILVVPLARGPVGFYSDISERDVLDVMDDLIASYPIDQDQIISGGYSMGGYGTLRFAALYPDRFAAATNWVGFTGDVFNTPLPGNPIPPYTHGGGFGLSGSSDGALENIIDFVDNLRHIPIVNLYSGADELVHLPTSLALMDHLAHSDVVHDFYLHPAAEHLTYAVLDDWSKEAAYSKDRTLVHNPGRITFRTDASLDFPEYAITHDRAYWVRGIVSRAAGYADVDVSSKGCGLSEPVFATGDDAGFGPPPLVWIRQFRNVAGETATTPANRLEATLANVSSLEIDTAGACLSAQAVDYRVQTDGPVEIKLSDGRSVSLTEAGDHLGQIPAP